MRGKTPGMRDDYELVGSALDPRDITLDLEAANNLRDYVAQDYFPQLMRAFPRRRIVLRYDESQDVTAFGSSFGPNPYTAPDLEVAGFTGLRLSHQENSWGLRVLTTRYRHDGTPNKVTVRYALDVEDNLLLQARREVRVIRSKSAEFFGQLLEGSNSVAPSPDRKAFQRALSQDDCARLEDRLRRAAGRCMATLK